MAFLIEHLQWLLLYHCKLDLYFLRILQAIPLKLLYYSLSVSAKFLFFSWHIFFSSLIPSFLFFTPSKRTQNPFMTTIEILDIFFILIFISIVIQSSLFTFNLLVILIYACLFILMFSLYYYMNLIKLLKYGECRNYDEIFQTEEYLQYFQIILLIILLLYNK